MVTLEKSIQPIIESVYESLTDVRQGETGLYIRDGEFRPCGA